MPSPFFLEQNAKDDGPPGVLAPPIDFETGEFLSISRSFDPTDAAVFTALRTVRGSGSAVQDVGQKYSEHDHVDSSLPLFVQQETEFALRQLLESGQIGSVVATVETVDCAAQIKVTYENIAQRKTRTVYGRTLGIVG